MSVHKFFISIMMMIWIGDCVSVSTAQKTMIHHHYKLSIKHQQHGIQSGVYGIQTIRRHKNPKRFNPKSIQRIQLLNVRGGGVGSALVNLNDWIGASKQRSWTVLFVAIIVDTIATVRYTVLLCHISLITLSWKTLI
jgi:hypothetical protein